MSEEIVTPGHLIRMDVTVGNLPVSVVDVINERRRQVLVEGFTPEHDDAAYGCGALARAAACYARGPQFLLTHLMGDGNSNILEVPVDWPLAPPAWKPRSRREDLVRGAALMLAEIERLDRADASAEGGDV